MDEQTEMVEISRDELERLIEEAAKYNQYREHARQRKIAMRARRKAEAQEVAR